MEMKLMPAFCMAAPIALLAVMLLTSTGTAAYVATSNILYSSNTILSSNVVNCLSLTIDSGAVLTTNGYYVVCTGNFINNGEIITGNVLNGGAAHSRAADMPNSLGGSGGGSGGMTLVAGLSGGNTIVPGGAGGTIGAAGGNGISPSAPAVTNANIIVWSGNIVNYLSGAGGSGSANAVGGSGAYGLYIQAGSILAGNIIAAGANGGSGTLLSSAGGGGGGGGFVLFSNGIGGYTPGTYNVVGGLGGLASTGDGMGGNGGNGNAIAYGYGSTPPLDIISLPTIVSNRLIIDTGQVVTFSTSFVGGVSPYTYNWLVSNSATHGFVADAFFSSTLASNSFTWNAPTSAGGNTIVANVVVTDTNTINSLGSGIPVNSVYSSAVTVNKDPLIVITPSANTINALESVSLSNTITFGTTPYSEVTYSTNAPNGGYAISGNVITFNSIGTFSITSSMTDNVGFAASNTISITVNGVIQTKEANVVIVLTANIPANVVYQNANTVLSIMPTNNVNAGLFINNLTSTTTSAPSLSGFTFSKVVVLNMTITSGMNSISAENVIVGYPCSLGSNVFPYMLANGIWNAVTTFTINTVSCTASFSIPVDPIFGLFQKSSVSTSTSSSGPPHKVTINDSVNNTTISNIAVIKVFQVNPFTGMVVSSVAYNQNQLPVVIYPSGSNYVNFTFVCSFSSVNTAYSYANDVYGLGFYKPCDANYSVINGDFTVIYKSIPTNTTTTSITTVSTNTTTTLPPKTATIPPSTSVPASTTTIVALTKQNYALPIAIYVLSAIIAIIAVTTGVAYLLMRAGKKRQQTSKRNKK